MYFWPKTVMMMVGISTMMAEAAMRCHSMPISLTNCTIVTVRSGVLLLLSNIEKSNSFHVHSQHISERAKIPGSTWGTTILKYTP